MLKRLSSALILAVALCAPAYGAILNNGTVNTVGTTKVMTTPAGIPVVSATTVPSVPTDAGKQVTVGTVAPLSPITGTAAQQDVAAKVWNLFVNNTTGAIITDETFKDTLKNTFPSLVGAADFQTVIRPLPVSIAATTTTLPTLFYHTFTTGGATDSLIKNAPTVSKLNVTKLIPAGIKRAGDSAALTNAVALPHVVGYAPSGQTMTADEFLSYVTNKGASPLPDGYVFFASVSAAGATSVLHAADTFTQNSNYRMYVAIKDQGPFDLDATQGSIVDPDDVHLGGVSSDDGGDSGCVFNPAAGLSLDLVLLGLGGVAFGLSRRFRK